MIIFAIGTAAFVAGAMAGVIGFLRAGIVREERDQSLLDLPTTRASVITRRLVGLHVRSPRYVIAADEETAPSLEHRPAGHPCTTGQGR